MGEGPGYVDSTRVGLSPWATRNNYSFSQRQKCDKMSTGCVTEDAVCSSAGSTPLPSKELG